MTDMEAIEKMAGWILWPESRPRTTIATKETLWRMAYGFANPNSEWHEFAKRMKTAIEEQVK